MNRFSTVTSTEPSSGNRNEWTAGVRVWIERAGQSVLGQGRAQLLAAIDELGSIRQAAQRLGMAYRHAWAMVDKINSAAGIELVCRATGGAHGGGARLTDAGKQTLAVFREFQDEMRGRADAALPLLFQSPAGAPPAIHVAAAISLQEVVGQLLPAYAQHNGSVPVRVIFGASNELADYLLAGAATDLFLSADAAHLARLRKAGLLGRGAPRVLARNALAAIQRAGKRRSASDPRDLLDARFGRIAVAEALSPLGACTHALLEQAGILEDLRPRLVMVDNSRGVLAAMRGGKAETGFAFASDARAPDGCRTLFFADPSCNVRYVGGVLRRGACTAEARRLLNFLTSAEAQRVFEACGFRPSGP